MKLVFAFCLFCLSSFGLFAQDFLRPLGTNPDILKPIQLKSGANTFDSTFIYTSDTIVVNLTNSLFDEFTNDHFQKYVADFSDPSVTFDKRFKLLNKTTNLPLALNVRYSNIPTFRITRNVAAGTAVSTLLPADTIQVTNFAVYPPEYISTTVYPAYDIIDTVDFSNDSDTIWQISPFFYQDSATQFFANLSDPNAYWLDRQVYHNYRFADKPWTLGVVTFDGLDENGYPYNFGSTATGLADVMHSKPINMSSLTAGNEVYLSFLYQTGGLGDPTEVTDSLVLEFFAPEINQWFRAWSAKGAPVSDFKKVHLRIQDTKYFKNGFQFRFKSYGGLSGSLDHFHVDYINLRASSGAQDTLFKDFAFVYPLGSFLKDYTSVPWEHYKNNYANKMSDSVRIFLRNGSNITENSQDGSAWITYNNAAEGNFVLTDVKLTNDPIQTNYAPRTFFESFHDFSSGYRFDETKTGDQQVFDLHATATAPFAQITLNDTATSQQVFSNYYAYDDGSAEQVYGTTGPQSMLAYQFTPYEADSLIGVMMHFVPSVDNVSNNLFLLTVWGDNNGKPGSVLYQDNFFFPRQPTYENERNKFTYYFLKDTMKLAIDGTFYVGWRQLEGDELCIGFDRNTINSDKIFYSNNNGTNWLNTSYAGSLMIRPVFSTALDASLGLPEIAKEEVLFEIYPNPAKEIIQLKVKDDQFKGALIFDLHGKLLRKIDLEERQISLSDLVSGVYFIRDLNSGITRKMIKN